jgi:GTP-binding protein
MQFIDEVKIVARSGKGGNGIVSFRREKNVPFGGPDGGNGGKGGDIIIRGKDNLTSLINFKFRQHFFADNGKKGQNRQKAGKQGATLFIDVPVGTQVLSEDCQYLLYDINQPGKEIILLEGGKGGLGNINFKSSRNQAPRKATEGKDGQEMTLNLHLKLLANVGLLGLPNAGKSTLLSRITAAKPKIADYPFSTIKPQLGVVKYQYNEFTIADIPGLIENSSIGQGLGIQFLKHLERCEFLVHIIDVSAEDYMDNYQLIRKELENYKNLSARKEVLLLSKTDLVTAEIITGAKKKLRSLTGIEPLSYSGITNAGLEPLKRSLYQKLTELKNHEASTN